MFISKPDNEITVDSQRVLQSSREHSPDNKGFAVCKEWL